jgi:hypothetical protein
MLTSTFSAAKALHGNQGGEIGPLRLGQIAVVSMALAAVAYGMYTIRYESQFTSGGSSSAGGYTCQFSCK